MRKMRVAVLALPVALLLAGCVSSPEPTESPKPEDTRPEFSAEVFQTLFEGFDKVENTEAPEEGKSYFWNDGSTGFGASGRYSVTYLSFSNTAATLCYEDSDHKGAFTQTTKPNDYSTYYAVSLDADCVNFVEDLTFKADLDGNGRYDLKIVDTTDDKIASDYVKGLQAYLDQRASEEAE